MRIAEVAYPLPLFRTFDYEIPDALAAPLKAGSRVRAPFGPRQLSGIVLGVREGTSEFKLKSLSAVLDGAPLLTEELVSLARWLSSRYCAPIGECLKNMVPGNLRAAKRELDLDLPAPKWTLPVKAQSTASSPAFTLTKGQAAAVSRVGEKLAARRFSTTLLFGVPASGKTEVYIRLIREAVSPGGQALFLVPEITLTRPFFDEFKRTLGLPVALWHSQIGAGARKAVWLGLRSGAVRVVVGARSASLLPFQDLRLVVMDEEQDESYKQDGQTPYYHARDAALHRAKAFGCAAVLGSATPSVEVFSPREGSEVEVLRLDERIFKTGTPPIRIIDRPPEHQGGCLSEELIESARACLKRGEQAILLVNRRGFSNFIMCRKCGWVARCPVCDVAFIHHKTAREASLFAEEYLLCHHCGKKEAVPGACGRCRLRDMRMAGVGTQKVVAELKERLPSARVLRMDRDTVAKEKATEEESIYGDFLAGKADILVGTKLVAKGFHFPRVTLVGVVDADGMLNMPDFRAAERTVQLLIQAAGRAGRAEHPGQVLLQTAQTTHYAIQAVARGDYGDFARQELAFRAELAYPPKSTLVRVVFQGKKEEAVRKAAQKASEHLRAGMDRADDVLGPAPGVHAKLQGRFRFHLLLKILDEARLPGTLNAVRDLPLPSTVRVKVNVDPYDFF